MGGEEMGVKKTETESSPWSGVRDTELTKEEFNIWIDRVITVENQIKRLLDILTANGRRIERIPCPKNKI